MLIRYLKLVADFTPELVADIIQNTHYFIYFNYFDTNVLWKHCK